MFPHQLYGAFLIFITLWQMCLGTLPPSITTCHRNNPEIEDCIIQAVENIRPLLATGDLGDGFHTPPLEPLYLDNIEMGNGPQFQAVFSDMTVRGGSNFIINRLMANASDLSFDLLLTLPRLDFTAKYLMKLQILLVNIQGKGNVKGYCEHAKALVKIRGKRVPMDDGKEYVRFTKLPLRIKIHVFKMHLDNLFNGDPVLSEVGNTIINSNQDLYLTEIIPGLEKGLSKKFLDIANGLMSNTTFDEMFPL